MWRKGNPYAPLVGMYLSQKTKNRTTIWLSNHISGYLSEENENTNLRRYLHTYIHYSIICNYQATKTTEVSINE